MKKSLPLHKHLYKFGIVTEKNESYKTVKFEYDEQKYKVYLIKKPIRKSTIIHCEEDGTIYREQLYNFLRYAINEKTALVKPKRQDEEITIVLFSGKPNFRGLDNGIFASAKSKSKNANSIYVMTKKAFKKLSLGKYN